MVREYDDFNKYLSGTNKKDFVGALHTTQAFQNKVLRYAQAGGTRNLWTC